MKAINHENNLKMTLIVRTLLLAGALALLAGCASYGSQARGSFNPEALQGAPGEVTQYRNWDYLVDRLRRDGVSEEELSAVFQDERMPVFSFVPFQLKPKESAQMYAGFTTDAVLERGREFLKTNKRFFGDAEQLFDVSRYTIAAILLVETKCGDVTGRELVVNRLARISSVDEPENLRFNYEKLALQKPDVDLEAVTARAKLLIETFYPELLALFKMGRDEGTDLLELRGSSGGAFGMPQFLPSSFLSFAIDGDGDGKRDLFSAADAIWSTAYYLKSHGWDDNGTLAQKRKVLWQYNRSEAYGDAVLKVAILLKEGNKNARKAKSVSPSRSH